ncbi:MAG TPA: cyclopropane-fatty-acyl-phospholipid synthase [Rhodobacteraceae bacterium]|nr:cyclopropane-fatty-acyl-phospholipid synthase [Paracoccaceae bacterium]
MSLDLPINPRPKRIAIVGGGISGLAAACLLAPHNAVSLFEASPRLGGHARTVTAGINGDQPVDTGFIVFTDANYPHLTKLFRDLDIPVARSDMSFGASIDGGRIEYGLRTLSALTAQKRNLLRPGFARMVRDILRFNAKAETLAGDDSATIGELRDAMRLGSWFKDYYLTPLSGPIWSTPPEQIRAFPARALIQVFRNHALLSTSGQHQWWTVDGGSVEYVRRLERALRGRAVAIHAGTRVHNVVRDGDQSIVHSAAGPHEAFDHVIFACHPDQALRLLERPTKRESAVLSAQRFQDNEMILHRDGGQMPKRRAVWSSWVCTAETRRPQARSNPARSRPGVCAGRKARSSLMNRSMKSNAVERNTGRRLLS